MRQEELVDGPWAFSLWAWAHSSRNPKRSPQSSLVRNLEIERTNIMDLFVHMRFSSSIISNS